MNRRRLMQWMGGMASAALLPRARALTFQQGDRHASTERSTDDGPFQPNWESLKQYKTPDWFCDAKFGIWAHWTAQCVPEQGDWYARQMYRQGQPQYDYHVAHYGHPSRFGFMQIDHLWKAEAWEPEELMRLYVKAGAKYFVSLANHHDNFDCFDSAHHPWNALRIGPKKDNRGYMGQGSARARAAVRRQQSRLACLALVSDGVWIRCGRTSGRCAL